MSIPDPLTTIREQLGMPAADAHTRLAEGQTVHISELAPRNLLPTEPGVYIVDRPHHHEHDHWWVGSAIFELSRTGYWTVDRTPRTADEVDQIRHGRPLIALVPQSEVDL